MAMSRLRPPVGTQPKSLPDPDHHRWLGLAPSPLAKASAPSSVRPGSLATYIWELWTMPSVPLRSV